MSLAKFITLQLGGRWFGPYGLAFCPAHDDQRKPSLSLSEGAEGRLLTKCFAGCSYSEIMFALRRRGLLGGKDNLLASVPIWHSHSATPLKNGSEKNRQFVRQVWENTRPINGTVAEAYLLSRGINCPLPESLRFHPHCLHGPSQRHFPALVARVDGAKELAITRTWLRPDGLGKAEISPPKAMLGSCKGGAVRLMDNGGRLVVAEGIETALSLACGLISGAMRLWAALSTSGLIGLHLPENPGLLTIATDGDAAGRSAGYALADRAHALGWKVSTLQAPDGCDWNDILTMKGDAR